MLFAVFLVSRWRATTPPTAATRGHWLGKPLGTVWRSSSPPTSSASAAWASRSFSSSTACACGTSRCCPGGRPSAARCSGCSGSRSPLATSAAPGSRRRGFEQYAGIGLLMAEPLHSLLSWWTLVVLLFLAVLFLVLVHKMELPEVHMPKVDLKKAGQFEEVATEHREKEARRGATSEYRRSQNSRPPNPQHRRGGRGRRLRRGGHGALPHAHPPSPSGEACCRGPEAGVRHRRRVRPRQRQSPRHSDMPEDDGSLPSRGDDTSRRGQDDGPRTRRRTRRGRRS